MNILFISRRGDSLGIATRIKEEGYSVILYIEDELSSFVGNSLVDKPAFSKHLLNKNNECIASNTRQLLSSTSPDLVFAEGEGMGKVGDFVKEQNIPVFGSTHWSDSLSSSSDYATQLFHRVGIEEWRGEEGVRVECGAWWNGVSFLSPYLVYNEERFMNDSLGSLLPSAGHVSHSLSLTSRLFVESIGRMERLLKKGKYRGAISVGCVVTKSKVLSTHFTTSPLFFPSLLETYKGSVTDLLLATAMGRKSDGEFTTDWALSLLLSVPPYPNASPAYVSQVKGISPSNLKHIYLLDVQKSGEVWETAGASGKVMWVSARGRDVGEARKRVMKTVSNLSIEDVQYRTDVGRRVERDEEKLVEYKYL